MLSLNIDLDSNYLTRGEVLNVGRVVVELQALAKTDVA